MARLQSLKDAPGTAREYETTYILRPNTANDGVAEVNTRVRGIIESMGGKILKVDNWGKRRLAYPIDGHSRGVFVYFKYLGEGGLVQEIERNLRQFDEIVRFQTVNLGAGPELDTVTVNPDEVKFLAVEADEAQEVLTVEERLGLPPDRGDHHRGREEYAARGESADEGAQEATQDDAAAEAPAGEGEPS